MDPAPRQADRPEPPHHTLQIALVIFCAVLLGLAAYRGYGQRFDARPTEAGIRSPHPLDLNTAEQVQLAQLPGMGAARARAIDERRKTQPFRSVDELQEVHGFGPATVDKVRPYVRVIPVAAAPPEHRELEPAASYYGEPVSPSAAVPRAAGVRKIQSGEPPIDVNTASAAELQRLPGVGPATAQNIIAARPYRSVNDLDRAKGIGKVTLEKMRPFVVVK